jgi:hypothetical protein
MMHELAKRTKEAPGRERRWLFTVLRAARKVEHLPVVPFASTLLVLVGCSASTQGEQAQSRMIPTAHASLERSEGCTYGGPPSRAGFFNEVLFAESSTRTSRFDDRTRGSYHVTKLDVVRGLPEQARRCGLRLKAVLVIGPLGPLWTFQVVALVEENLTLRVNALVMPHARIMGKKTGMISRADAEELVEQIAKDPLVQPGPPVGDPRDSNADFSYRLLLAIYDNDGAPQHFHADFDESAETQDSARLLDRVDALIARANTITYRHGDNMPAPGGMAR